MAYFSDFSPYEYEPSSVRAHTYNIGWLSFGHPFETEDPNAVILERLWQYCCISVTPMRGEHPCDLLHQSPPRRIERKLELMLGSGEIRLFADDGRIFASPNLIYHYVLDHGYKLPDEVKLALLAGPDPQSRDYLDRLELMGLDWDYTRIPNAPKGYYRNWLLQPSALPSPCNPSTHRPSGGIGVRCFLLQASGDNPMHE